MDPALELVSDYVQVKLEVGDNFRLVVVLLSELIIGYDVEKSVKKGTS